MIRAILILLILSTPQFAYADELKTLQKKYNTMVFCGITIGTMEGLSLEFEFEVDPEFYSEERQRYLTDRRYDLIFAFDTFSEKYFEKPRLAQYQIKKWNKEALSEDHWVYKTYLHNFFAARDGDFSLADNQLRECIKIFDLENRALVMFDFENMKIIEPSF